MTTPIFINTFVVFVRLYWFERRFQNVVKEARNFRRTRSRTNTDAKDELDPSSAERGVGNRSIVVLHKGDSLKQKVDEKTNLSDSASESRTASSSSEAKKTEISDHAASTPPQNPTLHREITFADQVKGSESDDSPTQILPQRLDPEQHIAFLENQRNPKDKGTLRIPGPRDFDRGSVPEPLDTEVAGGQLDHHVTSDVERRNMLNDSSVKRNVAIDEPDYSLHRADSGSLHNLSSGQNGMLKKSKATPADDSVPQLARIRARTGTFSSLRPSATRENEPTTPYLSWQPTIGRNSAFVDLTEEQREELGGIEYRSLKTLAVILVCEYNECSSNAKVSQADR